MTDPVYTSRVAEESTAEKRTFATEVELIPWWSVLLAVVVVAGIQVLFHSFIPKQPNPPPVGFRIFASIMASMVLAALMLLTGYVNGDAKRRGMNRWLWTALVFFIPNAIGFIVYFLVRQPIPTSCGNCGAQISAGARFCPRCGTSRLPVCGHCGAAIHSADQFCASCGRMLVEPMK